VEVVVGDSDSGGRKWVWEEKSGGVEPFWRELMDAFLGRGDGGEPHGGERISRQCRCAGGEKGLVEGEWAWGIVLGGNEMDGGK
jgi:hypothetical protein